MTPRLEDFLENEFGLRLGMPEKHQKFYIPLQLEVMRAVYEAARNVGYDKDIDTFLLEEYAGLDGPRNASYSYAYAKMCRDLIEGKIDAWYPSIRDWNDQASKCELFLGEHLGRNPTPEEIRQELLDRNIVGQVMFDQMRQTVRKNAPNDYHGQYCLKRLAA